MTDPIRNPFRSGGEFTTVDRVAAFDKLFNDRKQFLDRMVAKGVMRPVNYNAEIGALQAIQADLKAQMIADMEVRVAIREALPGGKDVHPGLAIIQDSSG